MQKKKEIKREIHFCIILQKKVEKKKLEWRTK